MVYLIGLVVAIGLVTVGLVFGIDRFVPQKAKGGVIVFFGLLSVVLGYKIYQAIHQPIVFNKVKQERYAQVIDKLKTIRDVQEAYKLRYGRYTGRFDSLIAFIADGKYTITQQRDSSFMRYDRRYRIEVQVDTVVVDTLGFVGVKDSLFGGGEAYRRLMEVPFAPNGEVFTLRADVIEKRGYRAPVFEAGVAKEVVLYDQPEDLVVREKTQQSVEEVNGARITVGSLFEVSSSGNWPPIYDRKSK